MPLHYGSSISLLSERMVCLPSLQMWAETLEIMPNSIHKAVAVSTGPLYEGVVHLHSAEGHIPSSQQEGYISPIFGTVTACIIQK